MHRSDNPTQSPFSKASSSRRDILKGLGLTVGALALGSLPQWADAQTTQPAVSIPGSGNGAGIYRRELGDFTVAVCSDGTFALPGYPLFGANATKEEVDRALADAFISSDQVPAHVNVLAIQTPQHRVLVDTGTGGLFGPSTGHFLKGIAQLGWKPAEVTAIFLTHAHLDHVGGLLDASGKSAFPGARIFVTQVEHDFWTSPNPDLSKAAVPEDMKKTMISGAARILDAIKNQLTLLPSGKDAEIVPGVLKIDAPGHTPGHAALLVTSGNQQLLHITDAVHAPSIQLTHPEWHVGFDADPAQAVLSRQRLLDRAAADRVLVSGAHIPFPAFGHLKTRGSGFEWVPVIWEW